MSSSCEGIRMALKSCLIRSECVLRQGHLPSECLKEHYDELPDECKNLRRSLYECKRGMVSTLWQLPTFPIFVLMTESCLAGHAESLSRERSWSPIKAVGRRSETRPISVMHNSMGTTTLLHMTGRHIWTSVDRQRGVQCNSCICNWSPLPPHVDRKLKLRVGLRRCEQKRSRVSWDE